MMVDPQSDRHANQGRNGYRSAHHAEDGNGIQVALQLGPKARARTSIPAWISLMFRFPPDSQARAKWMWLSP
jgi:hypothetical protein